MVVVVGGVGKLLGVISAGAGLGFLTKYIEPWLEAVYGKLAVLGLIILFLQFTILVISNKLVYLHIPRYRQKR